MNTMSMRRLPSSTRGSPVELSTMIKVAASRGRRVRALDGTLGADDGSVVMDCGPSILAWKRPTARSARQSLPLASQPCCLPTSWPARAAAEASPLGQASAGGSVAPAFREHLEAERTCTRDGFDQAHAHAVAKPVGFPGAVADQR